MGVIRCDAVVETKRQFGGGGDGVHQVHLGIRAGAGDQLHRDGIEAERRQRDRRADVGQARELACSFPGRSMECDEIVFAIPQALAFPRAHPRLGQSRCVHRRGQGDGLQTAAEVHGTERIDAADGAGADQKARALAGAQAAASSFEIVIAEGADAQH